MRLSSIFCGFLVCFVPMGAACAQGKLDEKTTMRVMHSFGMCAAKKRLRSEKVLALLPGTPEEERLVKSISGSECLSPQASMLRFKAPVLRGAIAEALFQQDFDTVGAAPKHRPAEVFTMPARSEMSKYGVYTEFQLRLIEFASCVAEANPVGVQQLLLSNPTTPKEAQAWAALSSKFGPCMEGGRTLKFNKLELRGFLAEGLYRTAVRTAGQTTKVVAGK